MLKRRPVRKVRGKHCEHTFLLVGDQPIRVAHPIEPGYNPKTGEYPDTATCPIPRCSIERTAENATTENDLLAANVAGRGKDSR